MDAKKAKESAAKAVSDGDPRTEEAVNLALVGYNVTDVSLLAERAAIEAVMFHSLNRGKGGVSKPPR